jgi:hypothetical protein
MASDPFESRDTDRWTEQDEELDLDGLELPAQPQWQRCGAVHCIEQGPWVSTLVCCMRKSGHENQHLTTLGDVGTAEYWQEFWQ